MLRRTARLLLPVLLAAGAAGGQQHVDTDDWKTYVSKGPQLAGGSPAYEEAREAAAVRELEIWIAWQEQQLAYDRARLAQRQETFEWQQTSTEAIFAVVMAIVLSGLGLSFWHVYRKESAPTRLVIGAKGIEVSSRLIGLLVFVLSVAFFYLYLQSVYPISEVGGGGQAAP